MLKIVFRFIRPALETYSANNDSNNSSNSPVFCLSMPYLIFLSEYNNWTAKWDFILQTFLNTTIVLTNSHIKYKITVFKTLKSQYLSNKSINSISENTLMMHGAIFCLKCLVVCLEFLRTVCTVHHRPTGLHALWSELPNFVHKLMLQFFPSRMRALKFSNIYQWIHNGSESFAPGWNLHLIFHSEM